jgi:homoserine kinase type II
MWSSPARMALLTPMTLEAARQIGREYGLDVVDVEALRVGSVNSNFRFRTRSGSSVFARVYEEQGPAGAAAELRMLSELRRLGVPTAAPLSRRDGGHAASHQGKPVGVVPWIEGEILCLGRITEAVARRLGRALAKVHASGASLDQIPEGRFGLKGLVSRLDAIEHATERFSADVAFIRERLARHAAIPSDALPRGLIHGDLFRDNALWRRVGGVSTEQFELVALIDFESASEGVFVYDLMVTVHAWCYGSEFDAKLVRALIDGYSAVRPLRREEFLAMGTQGALAALRFATTRITDFSMRAAPGEAPARDYRRFLARLQAIENGALDSIIERGTA